MSREELSASYEWGFEKGVQSERDRIEALLSEYEITALQGGGSDACAYCGKA